MFLYDLNWEQDAYAGFRQWAFECGVEIVETDYSVD